ncbi:MAG: tRNA 2-thiouridine(34) synthase MnmA [Proteobacteria bacterium]|nr:tRNA 2-thiouridine(34) synthase MnmA [Pseudomonadota bacterium]MBU1582756.1 tRNA 2-thiouridine(34) synthase MnmA [Pseudomonadota bacterium]MBU2454041.1 tRNA 2-thiouridine(34) synthase MnmA [Pseudomonadota bacterium]MBU2631036.1 tRNA 2-thiouridine(34) synthase MnmA [Pseudomonadota bacterium]
MKHPVVAVALSGGVDSLVSGYLLKQKFKHVFGIHFTTGYEKEPASVELLEKQLGFPVTIVDLSKTFEKKVVHYFIQTYLEGKTPNPCIICNKEIKFGELLQHALNMGADFLATGHYATIVNPLSSPDKTICQCYLEKGSDPLKDQSYFLSLLSCDQLEKIIFPLAGMTKKEVKKLAESNRIAPTHPSESQDICFIQDNNFSRFIIDKQGLLPKHGNIIDMDGRILGQHTGLHQFTVGQRRGINCPAGEPYYVKHIDIQNNVLRVCFKKDLSADKLTIAHINWNFSDQTVIPDIITKIRYSHKGALSTLTLNGLEGQVVFDEPQNAITPGQAAVFYKDKRVLGAGIIQ